MSKSVKRSKSYYINNPSQSGFFSTVKSAVKSVGKSPITDSWNWINKIWKFYRWELFVVVSILVVGHKTHIH